MDILVSGFNSGFGWVLAFATAPAAAYVSSYAFFRCWGKLRVNAEGWHASGIDAGARILFPALRLFGWFQPLMRAESAISRRLARAFRITPREQPISDVVVELVPIS